jgi:DNA polymerase III delta prime subunit
MEKSKKQRVLSLSLRPDSFSTLIGQDALVASLKKQFDSGRIPHFYIISGPPGSGKTTLARIIATYLQTRGAVDGSVKKYDIKEVNASNTNGIDDIRAIIEGMRYQPIGGSKAKVVIMDEAHQITAAAQNALLTETEDVSDFVYYIFCTTNVSKINAALKRRAFVITPEPLDKPGISRLVAYACKNADFEIPQADVETFINTLLDNDITTPGLVLQACERLFCGLPIIETSPNIDNLEICRAVASGNWAKVSPLCKTITKADVIGLKASICGYLKAILMKNPSLKIATAIKHISKSSNEDSVCLPAFLSALYMAVTALK